MYPTARKLWIPFWENMVAMPNLSGIFDLLHEDDQIRCIGRVLGTVNKADYPSAEEMVVLQELLKENAFES